MASSNALPWYTASIQAPKLWENQSWNKTLKPWVQIKHPSLWFGCVKYFITVVENLLTVGSKADKEQRGKGTIALFPTQIHPWHVCLLGLSVTLCMWHHVQTRNWGTASTLFACRYIVRALLYLLINVELSIPLWEVPPQAGGFGQYKEGSRTS